jgi:putative ABC transport system permease protein
MFSHLLKPIWRRKSRNLMLSLEIGLAFVVVFAIAAAACRFYELYQQPIGFDYASVWTVDIQVSNATGIKNDRTTYDKLKRAVQALPEVESAAFAGYSPYENDTWESDYYLPERGASTSSNVLQVSDDFFSVMHVPLERGRLFSSADEGAAETPAVVDQRFAQAMFPGQDPLGKVFSDGKPGSKDSKRLKITGIIADFRNHGEFMTPANFVISRFSALSTDDIPGTILIRVKPGTPRGFEARLNEQLKLVRNDWSFQISPMSDLRETMLKEVEIPLAVLTVIASFLLVMVGFGLFGVLWQNTTKRIPEIGLRRAIGAASVDIYWQIIAEQLLLTSLAMVVGLVLLVQLPITGVFGENLSWPLFGVAALVSVAIMALVSVLCALYPAWRASRLSPTQALQYE